MNTPPNPHRFYSFLLKSRWVLLAIALTATAAAYGPAQDVHFDRSIESMFAPDDPLILPFKQLRRTFGGDQLVLAAYVDPNLLTREGLDRLDDLQERLNEVRGVSSTLSINNSPAGRRLGGEVGRPIREFFQGLLLDPQGETTAVIVFLQSEETLVGEGSSQSQVVNKLREIVKAHDPTGVIAGEPVMVADGFRYLEEDGWLLGWVTTSLLMAVILFSFRSLRWTLIPIVIVQASVLWTRAGLSLLGLRLSMVSSMLTAIVTVVGIAAVVHVIVQVRDGRASKMSPREALWKALLLLSLPILWSIGTDMVGFGSLTTSRVGPVQSFGIMTCIGALAVLVAMATMLPALALWGHDKVGPRTAWGEHHMGAALDRLATSLYERPGVWGAISIASLTVCVAGHGFVEVETDFTKNFHSHTPIVESYKFVESRLGGAGVWDVYLPVPEGKLTEPFLAKVRRFQTRLRDEVIVTQPDGQQRPGLTKVISLADAIDAAHNFAGILARILPLEQKLHLIQRSSGALYAALLGNDPQDGGKLYYRIMLRAYEQQSTQEKLQIIGQVQQIAQETYGDQAQTTGFFVLLSTLINSLLMDQWNSFALTAVGIGLMLWFVFGNLKYAGVALIPNALPIFMVLGSMGWLGLKINMGTVMIAAVSMGLSVDSSIHYLYAYRRARDEGASVAQAISIVHQSVGLAMIFSTLALIVGFFSLVLSNFVPTNYFGVLVSLAMLGGLIGNLVLLPLLLVMVDRNEIPTAPAMLGDTLVATDAATLDGDSFADSVGNDRRRGYDDREGNGSHRGSSKSNGNGAAGPHAPQRRRRDDFGSVARVNAPARLSIAEFLIDLFETGRVRVPSPDSLPLCDDAANDVLMRFDRRARKFAPGEPPSFDASAARWGAETLFRACQFLVDRTASAEEVAAEFQARLRPNPASLETSANPESKQNHARPAIAAPPVPAITPATIWSVDLTFQKLPELHLLTRGLAVDDPLVLALQKLGADWPLSSVGLKPASRETAPPLSAEALDAMFTDRSLQTLYIDRVLARRDRSRLADPRALAAAQAAVGLYPELLPEWAPLWAASGESSESANLD